MLTGLSPRDHGIVANGWYWRDTNEVRFWIPSNQLMSGERIWEAHQGTTAVLFWRVTPGAGMLLLPYLAWVSFATVLNASLWWLNRVPT